MRTAIIATSMNKPLTLTVHSTHFYLIDCAGGKLLIDAGWELAAFRAQMKAYQLSWEQIRWIMFTHHHPDHAGLVQAVRELSGARLILHEKQIPYLETLRAFMERKKEPYQPIRVEPGDLISPARAALAAIGVRGEIVETPGHSEDSISLVLDDGTAFIGDLHTPDYADEDSYPVVVESWRLLLKAGAKVCYHSHRGAFNVEGLLGLLE